MKAMAMSQRLLCVGLLFFFFISMVMAATDQYQAKPTAGSDVDQGMEEGGVGNYQGKTEWPELVGTSGLYAAHRIWLEAPNLSVEIVPFQGPHPPQAPSFNPYRVRVYVNLAGVVVRAPRIG